MLGLPAPPPGVAATDVPDRGSDVSGHVSGHVSHAVAAGRRFVVRSRHDRVPVDDAGGRRARKPHDHPRGLAPTGGHELQRVPAEAGGRREATIGLSRERVSVPPPPRARGGHGKEPLAVRGVTAREADAPADEGPTEWTPLTNRPTESAEQARAAVDDRACRRMIEACHQAMKTGRGIEEPRVTARHGPDNAVAMASVPAVHVPRSRCDARDEQTRERPARSHDDPLKVRLASRDGEHADRRTMTAWAFHAAVAGMGGYVLNPKKRPPGWPVLWRGCIRLEDMCEGVRLMSERCAQT